MITIERIHRRIHKAISSLKTNIFVSKKTNSPRSTPRLFKTLAATLTLLVLVSCGNSKLLISPLYNRLDDQMRGEFHKLAEWDKSQIAHFESRVGAFHVWHRKEELPKYADLLSTIASSVAKRDKTSQEDVNGWIDRVESLSENVSGCHPVNFSYDLMNTLSDEQLFFIERRFAKERKMNFAKYSEKSAEERRKDRVDNIVKWTGRIGFDFTKKQEAMLTQAFTDQVSLRRQYYSLANGWSRDLFILARRQNADDYETKMETQVNKIWTLLENAHQDEWLANRKLWRQFGYDFVNSLTSDQRIFMKQWVGKLSKTLRAISADEPSFKMKNNPEHGCLVQTASLGQ